MNYRTTEAIRRFAVARLEGCEVDDLDDGFDEIRRYRSLLHGASPTILCFTHLEDALGALLDILKASLSGGHSTCVIVPTKHDANTVFHSLGKDKMSATILGPNDRDQSDSNAVRIATMHRAKGLEFDEVVLLAPRILEGTEMRSDTTKRLKYVAITRARDSRLSFSIDSWRTFCAINMRADSFDCANAMSRVRKDAADFLIGSRPRLVTPYNRFV